MSPIAIDKVADPDPYKINLVLAWLLILLTFITGGLTGINFKFFSEEWLGGYSGLRRRMYRLGHVSLFALGIVNLAFYFTARELGTTGFALQWASIGYVVGALTMPASCYLIPHYPALRGIFYIPSFSLIMAGIFTIWGLL